MLQSFIYLFMSFYGSKVSGYMGYGITFNDP